jgi:hypothetical protein
MKATAISTHAAVQAKVEAERSSLPAVIMFCAIGLLLSLGVVILDQYIPGEWF